MSPRRRGKPKGKKKHPRRRRHHIRGVNPKTVTLSGCVSFPDPLDLSIQNGDAALWVSGDGQTYDITFVASPFRQNYFKVQPPAKTPSGPVRHDANGDYKYSVMGDGGCTNDPIIHIGP